MSARKAKFTPIKGLDQLVAKMVVPEVQKVVNQTKKEAQHRAPATKRWITMRDPYVRDSHRDVHDVEIPENLRFKLRAFQWDVDPKHLDQWIEEGPTTGHDDRKAPLTAGAFSFMREPRDRSPGHPVQVVHCRCVLQLDPNGVAKMIHMHRAKAVQKKVKGMVYAEGAYVIEAEYGDEYPGFPRKFSADGTYFMRGTVAAMAGRAQTIRLA